MANGRSFGSPVFEFYGMLVKRLAYPSQRGVDVAPVFVAFHVHRKSDDATIGPISVERSLMHSIHRHTHRRWIEPGEQAAHQQLLNSIFADDLEALADPQTLANLLGHETVDEANGIPHELPRVLFQLPRLTRPLHEGLDAQLPIGPSTLDKTYGWVKQIDSFKKSLSDGTVHTFYRVRFRPADSRSSDPQSSNESPTLQTAWLNDIPDGWVSNPLGATLRIGWFSSQILL